MDEEDLERLGTVADMIRVERREYNKYLDDVIKGKDTCYNLEDLVRMVGSLEAAYNHVLAAMAGDGDIYCALKHLSYCLILEGEMDKPFVESIYNIITTLTNGKVVACAACSADRNAIMEESKRKENDD